MGARLRPHVAGYKKLIDTPDKYAKAFRRLIAAPHMVLDTETTGLDPWHGDRICGIAVMALDATSGESNFYFPIRHELGFNLPVERVIADFTKLAAMPGKTWTFFNAAFDMHMMEADGILLAPDAVVEDVMLAAHLVNENEVNFKLKDLSMKYLPGENAKDEEDKLGAWLKEHKLDPKKDICRAPSDVVEPYACSDTLLTAQLRMFYLPRLEAWSLLTLWQEVNHYRVISNEMESVGLRVDVNRINQFREEAQRRAQELGTALRDMAGLPKMNPGSPLQVGKYMGLRSTAEEVLSALIRQDPDNPKAKFAKMLLEYRAWAKVASTYYTKYLEMRDDNDDIHCSLMLHGTISGRLSCAKPNLQAVPREDDDGVFRVKHVLVARPGYTMVSADYSQAEMRLAAHYTQDTNMITLLRSGADIHTATAEAIGVPRDYAKRINFGIVYGLGAKGFAEKARVPMSKARETLEKWNSQYPGFRVLRRRAEQVAKSKGFIRLFTGRCRRYNTPEAEPHKAMSNLIQGGVGEMMRVTIMKLHLILPQYGARMLLQVHDQILFEVPTDRLQEILPVIQYVMEDWQFSVPMLVDIKHGPSWGEMEKWKRDAET